MGFRAHRVRLVPLDIPTKRTSISIPSVALTAADSVLEDGNQSGEPQNPDKWKNCPLLSSLRNQSLRCQSSILGMGFHGPHPGHFCPDWALDKDYAVKNVKKQENRISFLWRCAPSALDDVSPSPPPHPHNKTSSSQQRLGPPLNLSRAAAS